MNKEIELAIEKIINTVEEHFKRDKEIFPVCMLFNAKGEMTMIPAAVENEVAKDILTQMVIPAAIVKQGAIVSAMVSEAWVKIFKDPKEAENFSGPVSEQADRKEIVFLNVESIHGSKMYVWDLIREEGKDPYIKKQDEFPTKSMETKGRYAEFFKKVL